MIYMTPRSRSLLVLGFITIAWTVFRPGLARERFRTGPLIESERISRALDRYRVLASEDHGAPLPVPREPVEPGSYYEGVPRLIRLLSLVGDLPADAVPPEPGVYEGELVAAVKRFQSRHGLKPDGRIDTATFEELNTPLRVRVRQLELALERCFHPPYDRTRPAIVLNVPEFRLRAYSGANGGDDDPELEMKAVVGKAPDHKSPTLLSYLDMVVFRPYWNVPAQIQEDELLPKIRRDRSWISANHFELVNPQGEVVSDDLWEDTVSALDEGQVQLRQQPGPKNALGLVKFVFPNDYGVYMHDTSARGLFARERRDLSHGCIRLEKPRELAEWVLSGQPGWSRARIDAVVAGTETISVKVKRRIQIAIVYSTAVVTRDGEVHFFKDIYGQDGALDQERAAAAQ